MGGKCAEVCELATYGDFERNMEVFGVGGSKWILVGFRGWQPMDDFKQNRGGDFGGRARAGWQPMARGGGGDFACD